MDSVLSTSGDKQYVVHCRGVEKYIGRRREMIPVQETAEGCKTFTSQLKDRCALRIGYTGITLFDSLLKIRFGDYI